MVFASPDLHAHTDHVIFMNLQRLSFLATAALCALPFLFPAESAAQTGTFIPASGGAAKKKEKTVGTVKIAGGGSIRINGRTAGNGAAVKCGDVVETGSEPADVALNGGKEYVIDPRTRVRLSCTGDGQVKFLVIYGGIHPLGTGDDPNDPLPYLPGFNGNFSGSSIGGGGSGAPGPTTTKFIPGRGVALFDSFGTFIRFL